MLKAAFDPFGYNHARKAERDAIRWYAGLLSKAESALNIDNAPVFTDILRFSENIRRYEDLKIASLDRAKSRATEPLQTH